MADKEPQRALVSLDPSLRGMRDAGFTKIMALAPESL